MLDVSILFKRFDNKLFSPLLTLIQLVFMSAAYIQAHFRLDVIMEANTMHSDQTAPFGAV